VEPAASQLPGVRETQPPIPPRWRTLWAFSRPHTVIGTSLSLVGLFAIIVLRQPTASAISRHGLALLAATWLAALAANVYIVGLNQLTDIALDRINKPDLPLASGALSRREALRLVTLSAVLALGLGLLLGPWLLATLAVSMLIGTAYSLPPWRLKRSALWAPLCIALVRGPLVNLGLGAHLVAILPIGPGGADGGLPPGVWLLALFMSLGALGIGIAKDLPDIEGDRAHAIGNLAVRHGPDRALRVSTALWTAANVATAMLGAVLLPPLAALVLAAAHLVLARILIRSAHRVRADDRAAIQTHYRLLWRLFHAEYLLMPLVVALGQARP
jgi:homogentisate phytyltransferase/homogentisate geranylgeranyltransferase